ncbi:multispanning membrane protein [Delphinella strobiligena]|nr:multispanning membrane protein [Delphinella strobiligena]
MAADYRVRSSVWAALVFWLSVSQAFYIPGWSIKSYSDGEIIPLFVNKVYSDNTQLQYAYSELPFVCSPSGRKHGAGGLISGSNVALNLGEVLRGDRIIVSDYELEMGKDEEARYLCSHKVDRAGLRRAHDIIDNGYVAEWIVDNLPGATRFVSADKTRKYYATGFKMGYKELSPLTGKPRYFINNHVTLVIRTHRAPNDDGQRGKKVIVGFEIYAKSIDAHNRDASGLPPTISDVHDSMELALPKSNATAALKYSDSSYIPADLDDGDESATLTIPYTYSVYFREEEHIEWANRWDLFFVDQEDSSAIHWLAIVNSLIISGLLTAVVAVIFTRTIRGEIKSYKDGSLEDGKLKVNRAKPAHSLRKSSEKGRLLDQDGEVDADVSSDDELVEDITGWKLVHGDVFRPPSFGGILAPLIGSGMQLVFMATGLVLLSSFGVLNPSFRGGYISVAVALFVFAGSCSGYFSARVYRTCGGQMWQKNAVVTATLFPGLLFSTVFILNLFVWAQASSTALPFGTLVALIALWLLVQLPLVYLGSWYGFVKVGPWQHPIKATVIPRQIPQQTWYTRSLQSILLAGLIPFAVIFIELLFVFKNLWQDKSGYYYVFGFLAVIAVVLIAVIMEVTVIAVYAQLCSENYHWWWYSFAVGASSTFWIFLYCIYYFFNHLHIHGFVSSLLFFAYSALACTVYALLTGTIGFLAAYAFVRRIYGAIKVD